MSSNGHYDRRLGNLERLTPPHDPRLRTMAFRWAASAGLDGDEVYQESLRLLRDFDRSRLSVAEQARLRELTGRCETLADGGWDFSRLTRRESDEIDRLIARGLGEAGGIAP